jgi:eukaryotic-like serine/threonine-protein kinase
MTLPIPQTPFSAPVPRPELPDAVAAAILGDLLLPMEIATHQPGDVIGAYVLVEQLGTGGFGTVWLAEQEEPILRTVALKILKLGMDTLEVMARFEQERKTLALMDHPNIAKVLDAGATPEGRPFFAMEVVHGSPLTRYCLEKKLPLEEQLRLFQGVCAGVQHAHQKGIIHRDLKPSNILVTEVDGSPVPKIIDFGIAKATTTDRLTDQALVTRAESLLGTPLYMSPEQADAQADIDTRSDVYSLGAVLYELISGQPPSERNDKNRRQNDESKPRGDRQHSSFPLLHSSFGFRHSNDLDLITLKALEKDRARRYQTATALGEEIQRFLDHEPILARRPEMTYLVQRWVRRNRGVTTAALLLLLALLAGLGSTYRQKLAAQAQERQADAMLQMMLGVLAQSNEMRLGRPSELTELITQIADQAAKFPADHLRLMRLESAIGTAFVGLSNAGLTDVSHGLTHLERAESAALAVGAAEEDLIPIRLLLLRKLAANPATAKKALLYADKLETAHTDLGARVRVLALKAYAQLNLKQPQVALATFETMLQLIRSAQPPLAPVIVIEAREAYACTLRAAGRPADGLAAAQETAQMADTTPDLSYGDIAAAQESLGLEYLKAEKLPEAQQCFQRAFDLRRPVLGHQYPLTLSAEDSLIRTTELMGQTAQALALRQDQLTLLQEEIGVSDLKVLNRLSRLLTAYEQAGQLREAEALILRTLAPHYTASGDISPKATALLHRVFGFYRDQADWQRMEATGRTLLRAQQRQEPDGLLTAAVQAELARALHEQGRQAEAVQEATAARRLLEPRKGIYPVIQKKWLPLLDKILETKSAAEIHPPQ